MGCRILFLVGQLRAGGLERQLYLLLRALDRDYYRPEVVVWSISAEDTYKVPIQEIGVPLHFFPESLTGTAKLMRFRRLVNRLRPEIVHSYSFYTNIAAWWATRGTNAVPIGSMRSDLVFEREIAGPILGRLSGRWPRHQICNSYEAATTVSMLKSLFIPKNIFVVPNGVDLQSFKMECLPTHNPPRILAVGSLLPVKRWDRLLRAALQLKLTGVDFVLKIAGDGPLRHALEAEARELGVADRVHFLGYSSDIPRLLSQSTFLAHSSDTEGTPNSVIEAMACGRAVLATDAGDIPSLVENGKTGFVVRRGDDDAFLERLLTLLTDWDLCRRMGEAGRNKAEREFGLDGLVSTTLAAYRSAGWKGDTQ